jgi:hypothetical protein
MNGNVGLDNKEFQIRAQSAPWWQGIEVVVYQRLPDSQLYVVKNIEMETQDVGLVVDPTFRLSRQQAQTLMDDLWVSGLRPTEGQGSAGSLSATQKHLDDMRKIVAKKLGIEF